jgi:hypothetical protein
VRGRERSDGARRYHIPSAYRDCSSTRRRPAIGGSFRLRALRRQSMTAPHMRLATVPVIVPAWSEDRKTAVSATSASVGSRFC